MKHGTDLLMVARRVSREIDSHQLVLVAVNSDGTFATCSYGRNRRACNAIKPLCDAIADGIASGRLPDPRER